MKLFKLLQLIPKRELQQVDNFLATALFNQRADERKLFKLWVSEKCRSHPAENYWTKLFPKKAFSKREWNLLTSRLLQLVEKYLIFREVNQNKAQQKFLLAKVYRDLQQSTLFEKAAWQTGKALEEQTYRNTNYLQQKHNLSFEHYDYVTSFNRKAETNLQEVCDNLDRYLIAEKLKQACLTTSRQTVNQEQYNVAFLEAVLKSLKDNPALLDIPAIAVYYYCYQTISGNPSEYFTPFLESIKANQGFFQPAERRDIYTFAINHFIRQLNTGSEQVINNTFELYLLILEAGYLIDDGIILESTYTNIVWLAAKLERYDWAIEFIKSYRKYLKPKFKIWL